MIHTIAPLPSRHVSNLNDTVAYVMVDMKYGT